LAWKLLEFNELSSGQRLPLMESRMKLSIEMHRALAMINAALLKGDDASLEAAFDGVDLGELLSQKTITVVRGLGKSPLVLLLCTLAEHNDVEVADAKRWLAAYQSIARKQFHADLKQLSARHIRRLAVEALMLARPIDLKSLGTLKIKGSPQDWQEAIELLIDHKDWSSPQALLRNLGRQLTQPEIWGRIAHGLSSRHPLYVESTGLPQVDVDYKVLAALYDLCAGAARRAGAHEIHQSLKHLSSSALETAGDHLAAIRLLEESDPNMNSVAVQMDLARCYCKHGDYLASIKRMDHALHLLSGESTALRSSDHGTEKVHAAQDTRPENAAGEKTFDIQKANKALSDLSEMANAKGTPVFLVSGTLLGCIREGQLLSHDKDIDVGIVGWENQYTLCMALQESGLFTVSAQHLKGQDTYYIPICHNATGMWIDIFVYHPIGDRWVTGVDFFFGYRQTFEFTPFELKQVEFLGVNMNIPANPELNLAENYGQWQTPDSSYISHLESPSTANKGALPYMLTARLTSLSALSALNALPHAKQGSAALKLGKVLSLMREHQHKQGGMSPSLLERLSNRLMHGVVAKQEACLV
jgi:hypothetical protein